MTSLTAASDSVSTSTARPLPLALRIGLAVAAPLAPLAQGMAYLVSPYGTADEPAVILDAVAGDPAAIDVLGWLGLVIALALVPGVIATGLAALPRARRLATVALLIAVPGWAAGLALPQTDPITSAVVRAGLPADEGVRLLGDLLTFSTPAVGLAVLVFVVGHVIGTVLLGVALFSSRAVPRIVAALLTLAQPLHFLAFVVLQNTYLDVAAAWLTALGFGAAGLSLLVRRAY
jgi:hypothetical protein